MVPEAAIKPIFLNMTVDYIQAILASVHPTHTHLLQHTHKEA